MATSLNVPNMRVCAIDVGSNSTRYMIADLDRQSHRITVLFQGTQITRLGAGIGSGKIRPENAAKTLQAVERFFGHALSLAVSDFRIVGTAALREAQNSGEFCRNVSAVTGYPLKIIDGSTEAQLTGMAVAESLALQKMEFLGIDIGGGSTELIVHTPAKESRYLSLPLGAVRLTEKFLKTDPPSVQEMETLEKHVRETFGNAHSLPSLSGDCRLIGVGGTVTTLAAMVQGLKTYDHGKIHGCTIKRAQWEKILEDLKKLPSSQRLGIPGVQRGREDILVAGICILAVVAQHLHAQELTVSDRGVLYGVLVEYLEEMKA